MATTVSQEEAAQLAQTIEMFEVITQSQPQDYQSLEILKEAYAKLAREADVVKTSKRIARAYVQLGQFSSAILEFETILQRHPGDPEVETALKELEARASSLPEVDPAEAAAAHVKPESDTSRAPRRNGAAPEPVDDGRRQMQKLFVGGKVITQDDFDLCWPKSQHTPGTIIEPFIQVLADRGLGPLDLFLKLLSDKSRLPYLPLNWYDPDLDLTRGFPGQVCQRWCLLPFDRMSKSVLVATANPFNQAAAKELAAATPNRLIWYLAPPAEIIKNLRKAFR